MKTNVHTKTCAWDFPGGPVVGTLPSYSRRAGLISGKGAGMLVSKRPRGGTEVVL